MTKAPPDPWTVAIHASAFDHEPLGAGVVVDHDLVLTCAHVLRPHGGLLDEIFVAFPKASGVAWGDRRRVRVVLHDGHLDNKHVDIALLQLAAPVPPSVSPARLRCPPPADLAEQAWWAFGFPDGAEHGQSAHGTVGEALTYGLVHLDTGSPYGLAGGFSGGALWSAEYQAVVGIVVAATKGGVRPGDGHALTLFHAHQELPEMKLASLAEWRAGDADDEALAAWGWMLATDDEARRHWLPRARGVAVECERGTRFRGRAAALRRLVDWLDAGHPDGRVLVVTGSPGVGKSALLGRVVTTADEGVRAALPADDDALRATVGSVSCAVHAKGKTALDVAKEIARAAGIGMPAAPADLMPALRDRLDRRPDRFNLVIDALDEAASPAQARRLIREVIVPVARHCGSLGAQVVVGTRRADDSGDLLAELNADAEVVDLDAPAYFAESDLADYALATLRLTGAERLGNPYDDDRVAAPVARRIATLSHRNFLVAGLVARSRALRDTEAVDPARVAFSATVADALDGYIRDLPPAGRTPARLALTALAYADTAGLPVVLWRLAVEALGGTVTDEELAGFARTSAANFLVETGSTAAPTYRLFHQALNEALQTAREDATDGDDLRRLVTAWLRHGTGTGWASAPDYLLRALPHQAERAGLIDELLGDDSYLLHAHLDRLMPAAEAARSGLGRARAQLLQRTPAAVRVGPDERAALFSVVEKIDGVASDLRPSATPPYTARWARTPPRLERTVLEGHSDTVYDVAAVPVDGRSLLASADEDGTVRLWDPLTSQTERTIDAHADGIQGLWAVRTRDGTVVATASHDTTIKLWNPRTGRLVRTLHGHADWVRNVCAVPIPGGGELLVSASDDRTVRLWDPGDGRLLRTFTGHTGWVTAVCHVPGENGGWIASTGFDGTVRLWRPGTETRVLTGHSGWVTTLCAVWTPVGALVASAGYDGTVRVWNPRDGELVQVFDTGAGPLTDLCTLHSGKSVLLAATAEDGVIRLWDTSTGAERPPIEGYASWIRAICELPVGDRHLLATAGDDGTVRLWDAATGRPETIMDDGRVGAVAALAEVGLADTSLVASAGADGMVRLWEPVTGVQRREIPIHGAAVTDVCVIDDDGTHLVVASSENHTVQLWDLADDEGVRTLKDHHERVNAVCGVEVDGHPWLASAADDCTVRLWDVRGRTTRPPLLGHANWVTALAAVSREGRSLLASADNNGTVRLWDPGRTSLLWERDAHHDAVTAMCVLPLGTGQMLVSAGADRTVRLWRLLDGAPGLVFAGHGAAVTGVCLAYAGDHRVLVSASLDRTVRLWDPATGRLVRSIPVHHRALSCRYVKDTLMVGLDRGLLALDLR